MQLKNVVLPAPLGPMTLTIDPGLDAEVQPSDRAQATETLRDLGRLEQAHRPRPRCRSAARRAPASGDAFIEDRILVVQLLGA